MKSLLKILLFFFTTQAVAQYGSYRQGLKIDDGIEQVAEWTLVDKTNQHIVQYEYRTDYFIDGDTFDFPIEKIWRLGKTARIWQKDKGIFVDQVLSVGLKVLEPDTLVFERFVSSDGRVIHHRLCRHFPKIYRVQYALKKRLLDGGYIWNDLCFFVGWPDDYMRTSEVRTNLQDAEKQIRTKLAAGKRKAGKLEERR